MPGIPATRRELQLFPIAKRKTHKVMRLDLGLARQAWIEEAESEQGRAEREQSDFLKYQNDAGLFADFHSLRHSYITSRERAGILPRMARPDSPARMSNITRVLFQIESGDGFIR